MQDRVIKWAPFNSVFNGNKVINELNNNRNIINKPILSEDQINILNDKIYEAYTNHLKINIYFFNNFKIIKLNGFINKININKKCITFNNTYIYFNQILKITYFSMLNIS